MRTILAAVLFAMGILFSGGPAHALSLDEVLARAIAAQGGADKLRAVRTLRVTGTLHLGGEGFSLDAQIGSLYQRDGRMRSEFTLQGLTSVDALDAREGWHFQPFQGRREAERATADDAALMSVDAEFEGPLLDWQKKGYKVEYLGTEDVDGTAAHKLRVTRPSGNINWLYLESDSFLAVVDRARRSLNGHASCALI